MSVNDREQLPSVALDPETIATGMAEAETFLRDIAPHLGQLFGVELHIEIGEGWSTNLEPGSNTVTADPRFFIEQGYTSDMACYATLHEVTAHLREKITNPTLTEQVIAFAKRGQPQSIFHNVFSDIAGNKLIHATLPRMRDVAKELYQEKLFPLADYTTIPRHLQFLYKILRQEMIPASETAVLPEVDQAIDSLRNFRGQGDLIDYSTSVAKSDRVAMRGEERFEIWTQLIYPMYEELIAQDREDSVFQQSSSGQSSSNEAESAEEGQQDKRPDHSESQDQQAGGQGQKEDQDQRSDGSADPLSDSERFGAYYEEYKATHHPEPLDELGGEEHGKAHQHAQEGTEASDSHSPPETDPDRFMNEKIMSETGHTLADKRQYDADVVRWLPAITAMRDVFRSVLNERTAERRALSRRSVPEGVILNPDRLAQTYIDVRSNVLDPPAFVDYEMRPAQVEIAGKTDYVFMLDVSKSMDEKEGKKAKAATASTVIAMEALAALQRDIEAAEEIAHDELGLDIRTAVYTFGDQAVCLKQLSHTLNLKERLDAYAAVANPYGSATKDFLVLEGLEALSIKSDRRKILLVVSDGKSWDGIRDTSARARRSVDKLRGQGWEVYGFSIGSPEAERLYSPTAQRIDNPEKLPEAMQGFLTATLLH